MVLIFCLSSRFLPYQGLGAQEACIISCLLYCLTFLTCEYCLPIYLTPDIFVQITECLQVFRWVCHFPFLPRNIPCHYDPLDLRNVQLVRISCVIICVANHNSLLHIFRLLFPILFHCIDVSNTYKI